MNASFDELQDQAAWDRASDETRSAIARALVLPINLHLVALESRSQGEASHQIAFFEGPEGRFALLPGGRAILGQDPRWVLMDKAMMESWRATEEEYGLPPIEEYLTRVLRPLREVVLGPYLIEVCAIPAGCRPLRSPSGPHTAREENIGPATVLVAGGETSEERPVSPLALKTGLEGTPFRLPTVDQWEYACRGGTRTLFRWGNSCPADGYPTDATDFQEHRRPNAFGLRIADNPYNWEVGADGEVLGGDGGAAVCGASGVFSGWLPLASAYRGGSEISSATEETYGLHVPRVIEF